MQVIVEVDRKQKMVKAIKCHKPKFSRHNGRTWDYIGKCIVSHAEIYSDTTWGFYGYFQENNQWYKFKLNQLIGV